MTASPSKTAMAKFIEAPIREWTGLDSENWFALHPLYLAVARHHELRESPDYLETLRGLMREYLSGERQIPEAVQQDAREIDASQRANGYDGP